MAIVLNENEWAKKMIDACELGKKPSETLKRVARYYYDNGYSKRDIRKMLGMFLIQCDRTIILSNWDKKIDKIMKEVAKSPAVCIDKIPISYQELQTITIVDGALTRRLAFTLLCLSKYWDIVRPDNNHWTRNKNSEIMTMANIGVPIRKQGSLYRNLRDAGLVKFSKIVDATNVQVLFGVGGEEELAVTDFRNLGYQYMKYCGGGKYFGVCANCGITYKFRNPGTGRNQKYCDNCAPKIAMQQKVNAAMRRTVCRAEKNTVS